MADKYKKAVIFSLVAILALQLLYFTAIYKLNFPYSVDWLGIAYFHEYLTTGVFPYEKIFTAYSGHYLIFPRILVLPNLLFNSYDVGNLYFLQWGLLSLTLFFIYLLVKRTDKKLYWTLIPISAFIFSPLPNSNYWAFAILLWLLPPLGVVLVTYLLDKKHLNIKLLLSAISIAIVTTFSSIIGIVVWLPGIISLIRIKSSEKKWNEKRWFVAWLATTIVVGMIYYITVPKSEFTIHFPLLLSQEGFSFIATFASVPFRLKYDILMVIVGTFTILLSAFCIYYFVIWKKKIKIALPWIIFILVGLADAVITGAGRIQLEFHKGNEPYYIPMSHFTQIGLMVLLSLIILDIRNSPPRKSKKVLLALFVAIILIQMILLVPSYYAGWARGEYYFNEKSQYANCFSLSHGEYCVQELGLLDEEHIRNLNFINFWLENNFSIFTEGSFNQQNVKDVNAFEQVWYNNKQVDVGLGRIEDINGVPPDDQGPIHLEMPSVILTGWILDQNMQSPDAIYLLVDGKPLLKYDDFKPRKDIKNNLGEGADLNSGWKISFLSGYLQDGCHKIQIVGLIGEDKVMLDQEIQVCKNYLYKIRKQ
jgi:hypothetical protein